jgi:hypothetical protein
MPKAKPAEEQTLEVKQYVPKHKPFGDYSILWTEIDSKGVNCNRYQPGSDAEVMMWNLAPQPKVRTRIPREGKEPADAYATVVLNGLRINILKGVMVELPEQVAEIIEDSYYRTERALEGQSVHTGPARMDLKSNDVLAQLN